MLFDQLPMCKQTVALWYALLFDTGDACVSITPLTVLQVVVPFILAAYILQALINFLVFGRRPVRRWERSRPEEKRTGHRISHEKGTRSSATHVYKEIDFGPISRQLGPPA
ncbi:MAG: hypothetical protein AAF748_08500 [Pseudomonadota bacterium]